MKQAGSWSLLTRISWLTGAFILGATLLTQLYFARHERASLELRLREKANFINNYYSISVAEALANNDDVRLQQMISRLEEDPEITSVVVVDGSGEIRYHADAEKVGTPLEDPLLKTALQTGDGVAMDTRNAAGKGLILVSPLRVRNKTSPQGALRIEFTYKHIYDQVKSGQASFHMVAMGAMLLVIGGVLWGVRRWVIVPMNLLRSTVTGINPALLDTNFKESDDEFGQVNDSLNELLTKLRSEWANQRASVRLQANDETHLIAQLVPALFPETRLLIVDKENRVLLDTNSDRITDPSTAPHLLDLVTDVRLSSLVGSALQKEGEATRGSVTFQDLAYEAAVFRIPEGHSKIVKTIIALKPAPSGDSNKEAV